MKDAPFRLYAKLEGLNPGGSMKDRAAISIIRDGRSTSATCRTCGATMHATVSAACALAAQRT